MPNPFRRTPPEQPPAVGPPEEVTPEIVLREDPEEAGRHMRRVAKLLASGMTHRQAALALQREFGLDAQAAKERMDAAVARLREAMDDEGTIDAVMYTAAGRLHDTAERFYVLSASPIPERTIDVLGPDADDPTKGAVWRPLTAQELATHVSLRVQAAKASIQATEAVARLAGRRSQRWADKPAVVAVQVNNNALSPEDLELLRSLGMAPKE